MAVAAAAGTVGLAGGGIHFGEPVDSRLPFASYGFAAAALGVAVVLPMSVAALTGWRRHPRAPQAAVLAGLMLVGWIAVQVAVIRSYSWMQPVCGVWGLTVVGLGWRARRR